MSNPWLLGAITAVPLLLGALAGIARPIPKPVMATVLAFGAGTLIASVSDGLFGPAFKELGGLKAALALLLGTATFVLANQLLDRHSDGAGGAGSAGGAGKMIGWALLIGVLLDGIPENTALGVTATADVALLAAITIGNLPEAIGGAAEMKTQSGMTTRQVVLLWTAVAVVLALVVPLARLAGDELSGGGIATIQAFAGGAVLAVLSTSMLPEAFDEGGPNIAFASAAGFAVAFVLGG